jgi:hypothetical protein
MLFFLFQRASISKYMSFHQERLPRQQVMDIIREIDIVGKINMDTLNQWKELMSEHNRIVERGERMMLLQCRARTLNCLKFRCLDLFMLQIQSRYLAKLLDNFSSFGERVLQRISESPAALLWTIGGQIAVERTSWYKLCAQMTALLHALRMADPSSPRLRLRPWPDRALLEAAAARARGVFGRFTPADASPPSMRAPPSRPRRRAPPATTRDGAAAAREQSRRAAKRRREDSDPPRHAASGAAGRHAGAGGPGPAESDAKALRRDV